MGLVHSQIYADFTVSQGSTPLGTFRARLDYDKVPRTCANFIGLATGKRPWINVTNSGLKIDKPYYDGLTFHRLIHNFMIQGGSPNGQGTDGPGFVIQDEYHASLRHSGRYVLSMAKGQTPNSGGSQFFITLEAASHLDDKHSVFGEVISGKEIIDGFTGSTNFPTAPGNDRPLTPITMNSVVISGPSLAGFDINSSSLMLPHIRGTKVTASRNAADNSFTLNFDRLTKHEYIHSYSFDLNTFTPFRYIISSDDESQWEFKINGLTFEKFFSRIVDIDYSTLPNPPAILMPSGASLTVTDSSNKSLTLVSNGNKGGTWTDSSGASGTITNLITYDGMPESSYKIAGSSNMNLQPLAQVVATLDTPTGINNRTSFDIILSFHTATSGWTEGTASGGTNPLEESILQQFTYKP